MKLSVLGMGLMGRPIALRLGGLGHEVTVWNRTVARVSGLETQGLRAANRVADALAGSEFVLLFLSDAQAIQEVLFTGGPPELAGRVVLQMGTIAPNESRDLGARVADAGGEYLEAPVLGSIPEAEEGRLILMAGGSEALFARCLPLLSGLGHSPQRIGPVGAAAAMKLAMNQLIATLTAGFSLSLGLVRAEGLDVEQFMKLLRGSALYAPTFDKKLPRMLAGDFSNPNFPLRHLLKDVRLFRRAAAEIGQDAGLLESLDEMLGKGTELGLAGMDYSALYRLVNPFPESEESNDDSLH